MTTRIPELRGSHFRRIALVWWIALLSSFDAYGQVTLPGAKIDVAHIGLPQSVGIEAPMMNARIDARHLRIQARLHASPKELSTDPRGELTVRGQLLAQPSSAEALQQLVQRGYVLVHETTVSELDL